MQECHVTTEITAGLFGYNLFVLICRHFLFFLFLLICHLVFFSSITTHNALLLDNLRIHLFHLMEEVFLMLSL